MIARIVAILAFLFIGASASASTPRTGHWFNPSESGSGYNIDIQDGVLVVTIFSYRTGGDSEWYISSGPMSGEQTGYTGTLLAVRGGQCISCTFVAPSSTINSGSITINFTTETTATVFLPGGRVTAIQPFNFGFGDPPQGLLGEWVYVENIGGMDFADRYNFTMVVGATPTGNGIVLDPIKYAFCELQVSGPGAGFVFCAHAADSTYTTTLDLYAYQFGLDQTFDGIWISPSTMNGYPMKGYMSVSRSGFTKSSAPASASLALSQNDLKRQAERSFKAEAVQRSGYVAAIAAAVEAQRQVLIGAR